MTQPSPQVDQFVTSVSQRIDSHRMRNIAIWATLIGGALMLLLAICYVLPGYRVPWVLYPCVLFLTLWCSWCAVLYFQSSNKEAATFADRFFGLKNAVGSCLQFAHEGKQGGFYALQAKQTNELVDSVTVEDIQYRPPWRLIVPGVLMVVVAVSLGFKPASPAVLARLEQEKNTLAMTTAANEQIKELVDELEKSADDENERKMLEPDKLRQWVDELKETTDLREAKRQYAKMEMRLNRAAEALRQRRDEKLMDKAAEELKKDLDSAELAKDLKHKKYERAADKLKDLKPGDKTDQKFKPGKLSKSRKELAKLKAAAKRMAAAARKTRGNSSSKSKRGESSDADPAEGDPSEQSDGLEEAEDNDGLAELIEELDDAVEELDREFEEMDFEDADGEQDLERGDDDLDDAERNVRGKLDELGDRLMKMARRRKARSKLKKLSKKCAECQSGTATMESDRKGGLKAGEGSDDAIREQRDERVDNGQNTKLKGLKGKGPSLTQVQAADDGDGTATRGAEAKQRDFKRQFESFVDREDIPEDLKNGVKEYFTNIHQADEGESNSEPEAVKESPNKN